MCFFWLWLSLLYVSFYTVTFTFYLHSNIILKLENILDFLVMVQAVQVFFFLINASIYLSSHSSIINVSEPLSIALWLILIILRGPW